MRFLLFSILLFTAPVFAQEDSLLSDQNGDGAIVIDAFGDSITYGIGDGIPPGRFIESIPEVGTSGGYPKRLSALLGVGVSNSGVPGEEFTLEGVERFPGSASGTDADIITFMEGANDAVLQVDRGLYARDLQKIINVATAMGRTPMLVTLPQPCCTHQALQPFTQSYSDVVKELSSLNDVPLADVDRAWKSTCQNAGECELYNRPEGLHPNSVGYDVMAQTIAAAIVGVDVFAEGGAANLEGALGLAPGTIIVKPEVAAPPAVPADPTPEG